MLGETNTPFLSGSLAMSLVVYGLFSAFVTGPELLHREAIKASWPQQCARLVHLELQDQQPQSNSLPNIDLSEILNGMFGTGGSQPFGSVLEPFNNVIDMANQRTKQLERINEERLRKKAEAAGSRCACAVSMLTEHRVSLGLYAASGRLVTPPMFKNLKDELTTAMRTARCKQGG